MSASIRAVAPTGRSVYAHIMNADDQRWNGSIFEDYSASNWANYDVALTEQGSSSIYVADFPTTIAAGAYEIFVYLQDGGSPEEGDLVHSTSSLEWDGTAAVVPPSPAGEMTGSAFYDYVIRAFKRTDKEDEVYDAVTDTIREIRRRLQISDDEVEQTTTDTITTLGDYRISLESDIGLMPLSVVVVDGTDSWPLDHISKSLYDRYYPNPADANESRGKPEFYCIFANNIYLGPVPDSTSYTYRLSFTADQWEAITATTDAVPFSGKYREALKFGSLARLYADMERTETALFYDQLFERQMNQIELREEINRSSHRFTEINDVC